MVRLWTDAKPSSTAHAQGEPTTSAACEVAEMMKSRGPTPTPIFHPPNIWLMSTYKQKIQLFHRNIKKTKAVWWHLFYLHDLQERTFWGFPETFLSVSLLLHLKLSLDSFGSRGHLPVSPLCPLGPEVSQDAIKRPSWQQISGTSFFLK